MLENSPKSKGRSPMNAAIEVRDLIARIAGPQPLGHSIKAALRDVARKTGLKDRRVRALWNNEARAILANEMDMLRHITALEEARHAQRRLNASLSRAEGALGVRPKNEDRYVAHEYGDRSGASNRPLASE